jgi:hypothetical protein
MAGGWALPLCPARARRISSPRWRRRSYKALVPYYPSLAKIHLEDYKVRILDSASGTEAITRVLIDSGNGVETWSTVGASTNIIEASMHALLDSFEYSLIVAADPAPDSLFPPSSKAQKPETAEAPAVSENDSRAAN